MSAMSIRRNIGSPQFWSVVGMATLPTVMAGLIAAALLVSGATGRTETNPFNTVGNLFMGGYVHFALFFIAVLFGQSLIREELANQTYHYFLLTSMPRWIFVLGKATGFYAVAIPILFVNLVLIKALVYFGYGGMPRVSEALLTFQGWRTIGLELLVCGCAVAVYSAIFMVLGTLFKNMLYALFLYGWEISTNLMPETLRNFTVTYHLKAMLPFQTSDQPGFIGIVAEGPSALQVVLVLTLTFAVTLGIAMWLASWKQCLYGKD